MIEAADARAMRARPAELEGGDGAAPDAFVCAGLLANDDDTELGARPAAHDRALIMLPAGGLLSTAVRAQRLHASAVLPDAPSRRRLRSILAKTINDLSAV